MHQHRCAALEGRSPREDGRPPRSTVAGERKECCTPLPPEPIGWPPEPAPADLLSEPSSACPEKGANREQDGSSQHILGTTRHRRSCISERPSSSCARARLTC
eukprot:4217563-Alexandrium_andersonii.AAC.1